MATDASFVEYVRTQSGFADRLSWKKMFGEYALYLGGKVVAFACDNQLYVKPTDAGRAVLASPSEHSPFPGAKPYFRIDDELDDRDRLARLLLVTADALPLPKGKAATKRSAASPSKPARKSPVA